MLDPSISTELPDLPIFTGIFGIRDFGLYRIAPK